MADLVAAVVATVGIYHDLEWGWLLGAVIACIGVALYGVQETIGLPGLPRTWWEPSRLLTLALEVIFIIVAGHRVSASR